MYCAKFGVSVCNNIDTTIQDIYIAKDQIESTCHKGDLKGVMAKLIFDVCMFQQPIR